MFSLFLLYFWAWPGQNLPANDQHLLAKINATKGLVACWDFKEAAGQTRNAVGKDIFPLTEQHGTLPRVNDGPLSGYSAQFGNGAYLVQPDIANRFE